MLMISHELMFFTHKMKNYNIKKKIIKNKLISVTYYNKIKIKLQLFLSE